LAPGETAAQSKRGTEPSRSAPDATRSGRLCFPCLGKSTDDPTKRDCALLVLQCLAVLAAHRSLFLVIWTTMTDGIHLSGPSRSLGISYGDIRDTALALPQLSSCTSRNLSKAFNLQQVLGVIAATPSTCRSLPGLLSLRPPQNCRVSRSLIEFDHPYLFTSERTNFRRFCSNPFGPPASLVGSLIFPQIIVRPADHCAKLHDRNLLT
jgi:hypothetical protein